MVPLCSTSLRYSPWLKTEKMMLTQQVAACAKEDVNQRLPGSIAAQLTQSAVCPGCSTARATACMGFPQAMGFSWAMGREWLWEMWVVSSITQQNLYARGTEEYGRFLGFQGSLGITWWSPPCCTASTHVQMVALRGSSLELLYPVLCIARIQECTLLPRRELCIYIYTHIHTR